MKNIGLLVALLAVPVWAQDGAIEVRASVGSTSFVDDGAQNHVALAPSVRYYFRPKLAIEAELQYLRQSNGHYDTVLLPSFVWDIRKGKVVPYLSGGVGVIYSSFQRFSNTEAFVQGGVGVKVFLDEHWYVAPEFKFGWEPHARISGTLGYRWGR